jgi:Undecaprenyl-phosphate galactose phosphotransferase WbaP
MGSRGREEELGNNPASNETGPVVRLFPAISIRKSPLSRWEPYILILADLTAILAAFAAGRVVHLVTHPEVAQLGVMHALETMRESRVLLSLAVAAFILAWFWRDGHYSRRRPFWDEYKDVIKTVVAAGILQAALFYLFKWPISRFSFGGTWVAMFLFVPAGRFATKRILIALGGWKRPTVIIGTGQNALEAARAIACERLMGYDLVAFLQVPHGEGPVVHKLNVGDRDYPVMHYNGDPHTALARLNNPHVVVAVEKGETDYRRDLLTKILPNYRNIHVAPAVRDLPLYGTEVERFFNQEVMFLTIRNNLSRKWARVLKRAFDLAASGAGLIVVAPVFLLIVLRIRLNDGGPAFFRQERLGHNGRPFGVLKFRTMVHDAEEVLRQWEEENSERVEEYRANNFKLKDDPRVTPPGRWLRRASLDELPQLWNVFKGEMSLVGPRPLLAREADSYGESIVFYNQVRPGISGIWQISGRSRTRFEDRVNMDTWYIRNWSLWYDIYILLRTVRVVFRRDGAY